MSAAPMGVIPSFPSLPGTQASSAPSVKRSSWMRARIASIAGGSGDVRATPRKALVSSTVPYASTRALALATRPPPKSPVVPSSPVFV